MQSEQQQIRTLAMKNDELKAERSKLDTQIEELGKEIKKLERKIENDEEFLDNFGFIVRYEDESYFKTLQNTYINGENYHSNVDDELHCHLHEHADKFILNDMLCPEDKARVEELRAANDKAKTLQILGPELYYRFKVNFHRYFYFTEAEEYGCTNKFPPPANYQPSMTFVPSGEPGNVASAVAAVKV